MKGNLPLLVRLVSFRGTGFFKANACDFCDNVLAELAYHFIINAKLNLYEDCIINNGV